MPQHLCLVVLSQHIEGADDGGSVTGNLEAAEPKADPGARAAGREGDSCRLDLDAHNLYVGTNGGEPLVELQGGGGGCAVPQVDDEGRLGPAQDWKLGDPSVDTPQPIRARGAAGDLADGHAPILAPAAGRACRDRPQPLPRIRSPVLP